MASTYSNLKIQLMATGENAGTWGNVTNANLGDAIEQALVETATVTFASSDVTLTLSDSNSKQDARAIRLNLTGTTGGARDLIVPAIQKPYIVNNDTADIITVKNTTGTGIAIPAGKTTWVFNNGTNVVDITTHLSSLTLGSALPVASGGTGLTSPGTSGNLLTSNGTAWISAEPPVTFIAGMIILWYGSIASIPSGFVICDGTNSTPDLRDKFIVGAGDTYAVDATGGSADAIVVSHTHTATSTSTVTDPGHLHRFSGPGPGGGSPQIGNVPGANSATNSNTTGITVATSTSLTTEGSSGVGANLPPYHALAYIMKT